MKNLELREGYKNRHVDGLPKEKTVMTVIHSDTDGEHSYVCEWTPFNKESYKEWNIPSEGYLGTVQVIEGRFKGIGFHAWEQNNSEFIYYKQ
jgi:hypothetical protein